MRASGRHSRLPHVRDKSDIRIPTRREVLEDMRGQGCRIGAVLPYHYPRALLRALNIHPMEVWGPSGIDPAAGNRHFQAYTCAIVRNATSLLLGDVGRLVDLVLIPHGCDALQGMCSVLQGFADLPIPVLSFYPPKSRSAADLPYLVEELKALGRRLEEITGESLDDKTLLEAVEREAEADHLFASLAATRQGYACGDRLFDEVLRSREYLPLERFKQVAGSLPEGPQDGSKVGLLLSGIVPEPMALFDHLNEMGAQVVGDDLACGSRRDYRCEQSDSDPWLIWLGPF